jgi:hypothetical protein
MLASLFGWAAFAFPVIAEFVARNGIASIGYAAVNLLFAALFGIPIALLACWLIAAPFLWWMMARPVDWWRAVRWGVLTSVTMAVAGFLWARFQGWQANNNPNFHYTFGGGKYVQDVDGVLTPYGWLVETVESLHFVGIAFVIALLVRAIIGPGRVEVPAKQ